MKLVTMIMTGLLLCSCADLARDREYRAKLHGAALMGNPAAMEFERRDFQRRENDRMMQAMDYSMQSAAFTAKYGY